MYQSNTAAANESYLRLISRAIAHERFSGEHPWDGLRDRFAQTLGPHQASVIAGLTTGFQLSGTERGRQESRLLLLLSELKPKPLISVGMEDWWNYSSTHKEAKIEKREDGAGLNVRDTSTFSFLLSKETSIMAIFLVLTIISKSKNDSGFTNLLNDT